MSNDGHKNTEKEKTGSSVTKRHAAIPHPL